jgi:hypothetical protein
MTVTRLLLMDVGMYGKIRQSLLDWWVWYEV